MRQTYWQVQYSGQDGEGVLWVYTYTGEMAVTAVISRHPSYNILSVSQ